MKKLILSFLFLTVTQLIFAHTDSLAPTRASRDIIIFQNKLEITISIHKPAKSGFARIYEKLPTGAKVLDVKCGNGYYKADKSMLKVAWDEIPNDTTVIISYVIGLNEILTDTVNEFKGTFSAEFLSLNEDQITISNGKKTYQKEPLVAMEKLQPKSENKKIERAVESEKISKNTNPVTTNLDTYICIQVAAVGSNVNSDYLSKKFGYPGDFESHFEENFYRITIGKYHSIKEAQAALNELKAKYFEKCFLSAYKDGHKIPVYKAENMLN